MAKCGKCEQINYCIGCLQGCEGELLKGGDVTMKLGTEVTEELIADFKPDSVIVATGAKPLMPPIKGIDGSNVSSAEDVLLGKVDISVGPIVVCGGGEVGGAIKAGNAVTATREGYEAANRIL